ncbi:MAG: histidinol-phosphatase HisJ family protein [Promethearchaeota archaeon]
MPSRFRVHDLHIHTHFSSDSVEELKAYAEAGEQLAIHVGYLDHFELAFQDREGYLTEERLPELLEEFSEVHSRYPNTSLSLEVDYYSHLSSEVGEFCDNHCHDFDYLIGTVHNVDGLAVTSRREMALLVQKFGLIEVLRRYFDEIEAAIRSKLFDGIAHIDAAMRYAPNFSEASQKTEDYWRTRTLELGKISRQYNLPVEVNLTGLNYPWGRTHPDQELIDLLAESGTKFFVGSDSHRMKLFVQSVPLVRQMTKYLQEKGALMLPGNLVSL